MKYNGISFNEEWVKTKTEAEFITHESHHGLSENELKEAFALITRKERKGKDVNDKQSAGKGKKP